MKKLILAFAGIIVSFKIIAGVIYDQNANTILIEDFGKDTPLMLKNLYLLDRINSWNRMKYDKPTDTYILNAHLKIGSNNGTDSCLQIGTAKNPEETLIVKGNVIVSPYWVYKVNPEKDSRLAKKGVNLLTLGSPENNSINAALKIACEKKGQYSLYVGLTPELMKSGKTWTAGGGIRVYNSTLTAEDKKMGRLFMKGQTVIFDNAVISRIAGSVTYYLRSEYMKEFKINKTIFDRIDTAVSGGKIKLTGCTLKNCVIGAGDRGEADFLFENCKFENNTCNWTIRYTNKGITCMDCDIGEGKRPNYYGISKRKEKTLIPSFTSKRHIIIKVEDENGQPVLGAKVVASEMNKNLEQIQQITDNNGKVILLLTEVIKTATDNPTQPTVKEFSYDISISANSKTTNLDNIKPDKSWKVFKISLK